MGLDFKYTGIEALEIIKETHINWEDKIKKSKEELYKIMIENNLNNINEAFDFYLKNVKSYNEAILFLASVHTINLENKNKLE